jgi:hypothetical protein
MNTGRFFMVMAVTGTLFAGVAAHADGGPGTGSTLPAPIPTQPKNDDIEGRCHFRGVFQGDKKEAFAIECRARLEFDKRDLYPRPAVASEHDRRDRFKLECDGQEIYDDGLKVIVRDDDRGGLMRDRDLDVIFKGRGENAPKIRVRDLDIKDRDECSNDATLKFERWGYTYTLQGSCRFEKDHDHGSDNLL